MWFNMALPQILLGVSLFKKNYTHHISYMLIHGIFTKN
ncbi:hypothetical protein FHS10_000571 [Mucilaginibacter dorajii]|nr:hypothetical protein [Mucilaginibacter dorajii]